MEYFKITVKRAVSKIIAEMDHLNNFFSRNGVTII